MGQMIDYVDYIVVVGYVQQEVIKKIKEKFWKARLIENLRSSLLSNISGKSGILVCNSDLIRECYLAASKFEQVMVITQPRLGESLEVVGALRERGTPSGILFCSDSVSSVPPGLPIISKKIKVEIIKPQNPRLITWTLPNSELIDLEIVETPSGSADIVGGTCSYEHTYDARIVALKYFLGRIGEPVVIRDVTGSGLLLEYQCGYENRGMYEAYLLRPNRYFSSVEIFEGRIENNMFVPKNGIKELLQYPIGMTFLILSKVELSYLESLSSKAVDKALINYIQRKLNKESGFE